MGKFWVKRIAYLFFIGISIVPLKAVYAVNDELKVYIFNKTDQPLVTLPSYIQISPDSAVQWTFKVQGQNSSGSFQGSTSALFDIWRTGNYSSNYTASKVRVGWNPSGYEGCEYTITCDSPKQLQDGSWGCANLLYSGNTFSDATSDNGWLSTINCTGTVELFSGGVNITITQKS